MSDTTCPKCGDMLVARDSSGRKTFACGAVQDGAWVLRTPACYARELSTTLDRLVASEALGRLLTARAEKAEAEVRRLRVSLAKLYERRWEWVHDTMETGFLRCRLCGNAQSSGCASYCPTVTHPAEVPNANP